jgi:hypothetical protein
VRGRIVFPTLVILLVLPSIARVATAPIVYLSFPDADSILKSLAAEAPEPLRNASREDLRIAWPSWVQSEDRRIRTRLLRGDEDSVVNLLLFGTSFTAQPRLTSTQLHQLSEISPHSEPTKVRAEFQQLLERRIADFIIGLNAPGTNERLIFARAVIARAGIAVDNQTQRTGARRYLLELVRRVLKEQTSFQQILTQAQTLNDSTSEFAMRSTLYKERGLSLDTSLAPDFALEVAMRAMFDAGLLAKGCVKRVGIIGPGLDFVDKQEGYDFYPTQTVQPFAVMNSLLRLGLVKEKQIEIVSLDLSPRINDHLERARRAAEKGRGYTLHLPMNPASAWKPPLQEYWQHFGDQIATPAAPAPAPPGLGAHKLRAVRVKPEFVRRIQSLDVNIVLQHEEVQADRKFDLLIATNVFVYYDTFEQSLALANVQAMLRPGGFLLTNNLLLELPDTKMKSVDYIAVEYSNREADGDQIVWYRRSL